MTLEAYLYEQKDKLKSLVDQFDRIAKALEPAIKSDESTRVLVGFFRSELKQVADDAKDAYDDF